jgi:hypothetical protein
MLLLCGDKDTNFETALPPRLPPPMHFGLASEESALSDVQEIRLEVITH